ncbi:hypothetical protein L204_103602 [Cryptococcus depauperatus]|nr:hypothetical protein L204_01916 [Cryptococcus depauperatus CBS 7855]
MSASTPTPMFASVKPSYRPLPSTPLSISRSGLNNVARLQFSYEQIRPSIQSQVRPNVRSSISTPVSGRKPDELFARSRMPPTPVNGPPDHPLGNSTEKRRRDDGMRGTMRNEIARLMYGAGDVAEPDVDTVDYMEDMVVEFIADLCHPAPPMRSNTTVAPQPVPLSAEVIRHRLSSTAALHKYLERFDHMVYMSDVLKAHRRVAAPNLTDIIEQVGNDYLGLNENGAPIAGDATTSQGQAGMKRPAEGEGDEPPRKKGRPPKMPGERKKPGPQKGWKLNRDPTILPKAKKDPNAPKRKYVRKALLKSQINSQAGTPMATSN